MAEAGNGTATAVLIFLGILLIWAMCHRWFWILACVIGGIASFFAMIASIISFQILWAMGFLALIIVIWVFYNIIDSVFDSIQSKRENRGQY